MMARVLWLSDAGSTTGFARATHGIGDRLVTDYGHDVHCLAVNYNGDYWPTPIKLYVPTARNVSDLYGQSRFVEMLGEVNPDIVIMLNDPYVILKFLLNNKWDPEYVLARTRPILAYMPVDGYDQPVAWGSIKSLVEGLIPIKGGTGPKVQPVAMSYFGRTLFPDAPVVPHGIETDVFHPVSKDTPITTSTGVTVSSKADAKRVIGIQSSDFLILRVDRNSIRKDFADTWKAINPVMRRHKNVHAWFHCKAEGDQLELPQLISRDMETAKRFHFPGSFSTKRGWSNDDLAVLYNAADLFVSTSMGEGFGLTLGEASACGVPIVAQDVSSITEVVGPGGVLIPPGRPFTTESGQDLRLPDVDAFTETIEKIYGQRQIRRELGEAGREHVIQDYSWDRAAQQFDDLIHSTL
jgi:glycosyltransferase involved in cell wall biosynthesis